MTEQIDVRRITDACKRAFSRRYSFEVAARYGELNDATSAGLVSNQWNETIPEHDIQSFLEGHRAQVETAWSKEFNRLKRIISFGGSLEYEEMMQVLTLRSELEFCRQYVSEACFRRLIGLDQDLRHSIAGSISAQSQRSRKVKNDVCRLLRSHWWWRNFSHVGPLPTAN